MKLSERYRNLYIAHRSNYVRCVFLNTFLIVIVCILFYTQHIALGVLFAVMKCICGCLALMFISEMHKADTMVDVAIEIERAMESGDTNENN